MMAKSLQSHDPSQIQPRSGRTDDDHEQRLSQGGIVEEEEAMKPMTHGGYEST